MTEAPKKIWAADQEFAEGIEGPWHVDKSVYGGQLYHHDAEVQRLVAEALAEAFEEAANVVGDRRDANTAIWEKTGNPGWLAVLAHLDQARDAIRALSDAPPRQVTPQEAAKVLLSEWEDHGEGPLGDLVCYTLSQGEGGPSCLQPYIDGDLVKFSELEAALRALANGGAD